VPFPHDLKDLAKMAGSGQDLQRLQALRMMREEIAAGGRPEHYLPIACPLIGDTNNDCRWQALIVVGESVESNPAAVWDVICQHGESPDEDLRTGVATVLLEHLLEYHFDEYFPLLKERIEAGSGMLRDTLRRCWAFGQAEPRWQEVIELTRPSAP